MDTKYFRCELLTKTRKNNPLYGFVLFCLLGFGDVQFSTELDSLEEPCGGLPQNMFSAAQIVHSRIERFIQGQYNIVPGLATIRSAPTEYLGTFFL